ncbi:MAG: helix-turn-helix domain-containing protein, partial [SAR324 cluster bacterium]|nr:helix-turn-helix domain-containing protein [SAR324 cluster bacterium]
EIDPPHLMMGAATDILPDIAAKAPAGKTTRKAAKPKGGIAAARTDDAELGIEVGMSLREVEKKLIFETLRKTHNNRTQAAKMLSISIRTLRNKLNEYAGEGGLVELDDAG